MSQDLRSGEGSSRSNRVSVLAFIADPVSEQVVRDGLADTVSNGLDLRRGTIRTAIGAMAKLPTPEVLIVDLSGESQPVQMLDALSHVVEPGVHVLAIGETDDVDFYRNITRGHGVVEYIFKPLTRVAIARHFAPLITRQSVGDDARRGGRVIAVIGARGGVGTTSIAANLAWYLGVMAGRHTVFLEADLHTGSGALLLGGKTGPGLRHALESDTISAELINDSVQPIAERLHLMASEERLDDPLNYLPGAAGRLIEALRVRYNFIICDLAFLPAALNREILDAVHHRVIIIEPTLASLRDSLRLLALPNGKWEPQRPILVLNRSGRPGSLTRKQMEEALKVKIDITVPDLPRLLGEHNHSSGLAVSQRGPFQQMIAELSHQIGLVGAPERAALLETRQRPFSGLLHRLGAQRG